MRSGPTRRNLDGKHSSSRQSLILPMRNWGVTLVTNGGTAAEPPAAASSAMPVKKLVEWGVRHRDLGHEVGHQAHPPGHLREEPLPFPSRVRRLTLRGTAEHRRQDCRSVSLRYERCRLERLDGLSRGERTSARCARSHVIVLKPTASKEGHC
jgi:hypothetical protein